MRSLNVVWVSVAALLLTACVGDSERPVATGQGTVRAINTIPTAPNVVFLIEERIVASVDYAADAVPSQFDDLDYNFNFEVNFPDQIGPTRVATTPQKIERDREYTFVITGDLAAPTIIVWDDEVREFEGTETTFFVRFSHTVDGAGPVDVYFAPPGTAPALGEQRTTLAFGELSEAFELEAGDYYYTLTAAGDPNNVLFESETVAAGARSAFLIAPFAATIDDTGPLAVRLLSDFGGSSNLISVDDQPTLRFLHASAALGPVDIYADETLSDLILANQDFRDVSGDIPLDADNYNFAFTPAGSTSTILYEAPNAIPPGTQAQFYLLGEAGATDSFILAPDRRPIETEAQFVFTHTAFNHPLVDLYILEAGTILDDVLFPDFFGIEPGSLSIVGDIDQGDLEMYLTVSGEKTIIAGPVALTAELGDYIEYVSYDNVDPATADLVAIPLP